MENNPIIAGNWKMNKTPSEGNAFISEIMDRLAEIKNINIILSPPLRDFMAHRSITHSLKQHKIAIGKKKERTLVKYQFP